MEHSRSPERPFLICPCPVWVAMIPIFGFPLGTSADASGRPKVAVLSLYSLFKEDFGMKIIVTRDFPGEPAANASDARLWFHEVKQTFAFGQRMFPCWFFLA